MDLRPLTLVLACLAAPAHAASFDCAKASSKVEKLVCADPALGALDDRLAVAYKAALRDEFAGNEWGRRAPRADDQRRWLREVRDRCADAACLRKAYADRIAVLAAWHEPADADAKVAGQYSADTKVALVSGEAPGMMEASDCLSIVPRGDGDFDIAIDSVHANAHTCTYRGRVRADGTVFRGVPGSADEDPSLEEGEAPCNVSVLVERGELRVHAEGTCTFHCGARAHLDGLVFLRGSRKPGPAVTCADPYAE